MLEKIEYLIMLTVFGGAYLAYIFGLMDWMYG